MQAVTVNELEESLAHYKARKLISIREYRRLKASLGRARTQELLRGDPGIPTHPHCHSAESIQIRRISISNRGFCKRIPTSSVRVVHRR